MEEDIKVLEHMRDNIYGAMQFEDDYQVFDLEEKQFNALNLAIKHLRKTKLVKNNYIPKLKVREILEKDIGQYMQFYRDIQELLQEGDK